MSGMTHADFRDVRCSEETVSLRATRGDLDRPDSRCSGRCHRPDVRPEGLPTGLPLAPDPVVNVPDWDAIRAIDQIVAVLLRAGRCLTVFRHTVHEWA